MKFLAIALLLFIATSAFSQKYKVGLVKTGTAVKNVDGVIAVTDSTVSSTIDGSASTLKILSRKGYTIHVTDGTMTHKYIISTAKGRLHGFTYDRSIKYELDKRHSAGPHPTYLCLIQRDSIKAK
jgi:hypothetical protein